MTEFQKAAIGFMRLMEESRTPKQSQRDVVNYLNNNFFVRFDTEGKSWLDYTYKDGSTK